MKNDRVAWIDTAKGMGLIAIIAGHLVTYGSYVSMVLFAFHVPLFFFLSGAVYKKQDMKLKTFLFREVKRLLIPFWGMYFLMYFICVDEPLQLKEGLIADMYLAHPCNNLFAGHLWFLFCLFWVRIFYKLGDILLDNKRFNVFPTAIRTCVPMGGYAIYRLFPYDLLPLGRMPLKIDTALVALIFYAVGHWFKKASKNEFFSNMSNLWRVAYLVFACFVYTFVLPRKEMSNVIYLGYSIKDIMVAFVGIMAIVFIAFRLHSNNIFNRLGKMSMGIFMVHYPLLYLWAKVVSTYRRTEVFPMNNMQLIDCVLGTFFVTICSIGIVQVYLMIKNNLSTCVRRYKR